MIKFPAVDALKGALIVLVIVGHVAEVVHYDNILFWIGAGFRMPLMFGISGFLLNLERIRQSPLVDIAKQYWKRMILAWLVASCAYAMAVAASLSWATPLDMILRPDFHLWYVPVLAAMILMARTAPPWPLGVAVLSAPIGIGLFYANPFGHGLVGEGVFAWDGRFLAYPLFFFFGGAVARARPTATLHSISGLVAGCGLLGWCFLYQSDNELLKLLTYLAMDLGLIALLPLLARLPIRISPLNAIGQASLFYYLWHPMVIALAIAHGASPLLTLVLTLTALCVMHRLLTNAPLPAQVFGVPQRYSAATKYSPSGGALSPSLDRSAASSASPISATLHRFMPTSARQPTIERT
ncbi:fucose 4-O-acetylase-like acetyltransferase [Sphingobium subterraneum]|uniref:Fucose 4-O-acetylase-like acetyltransferase n=1 Tax=Sphingobium subterraneum TaxID=627688 RepID=A0A841J282_9SPHN|nr:fucose 4-O-acetylase-like acetyltransferase [Sphingobium subterraneum]